MIIHQKEHILKMEIYYGMKFYYEHLLYGTSRDIDFLTTIESPSFKSKYPKVIIISTSASSLSFGLCYEVTVPTKVKDMKEFLASEELKRFDQQMTLFFKKYGMTYSPELLIRH